MAIIDSVKLPDNSTYDLTDNHSGYQKETLATPITVDGTSETTVEGALGGLNDYGDALADNLAANENVYGAKNILSYPYEETTKTENGVAFTDNGDGTISVVASSGATADTYFGLHYPYKPLYVEKGTYILSGCPTGGSDSTYFLSSSYGNDTGDGITVTESSGDNRLFLIVIKSGTVISTPITFKPMICDARIIDPTFAPFAMTNKQLTDELERTKHHKIYEFAQYTTATADAWEYTGVSITIPAKTFFGIQGIVIYANGRPTGVALNNDSSVFNEYNCWAIEQSGNGVWRCSICGYTPEAQTLYLWAKRAAAGVENGHEINGWYVYE